MSHLRRKGSSGSRPSSARPPRERALSTDEIALWRHVTRDTLPLEGRESGPAAAPPPSPKPAPAAPLPAASGPLAGKVPGAAAAIRPAIRAVMPAPHGIDRRMLQRLGRGLVAIDARLDLHGLTQEEAHRHLALFLAHHQRQGARCLLVITGIGDRSGGILRRMTPRWLAETGNAQRVIAHAPAQKRHGGEGALYVLLRRIH